MPSPPVSCAKSSTPGRYPTCRSTRCIWRGAMCPRVSGCSSNTPPGHSRVTNSCEREDKEDTCNDAGAVAEQKQGAAYNLGESGEAERHRWQRQSDGLDVTDGHRRCSDLR